MLHRKRSMCAGCAERLESRLLLSTLQGTLWEDLNASSVPDEGESPLAGAGIFLDMNRSGVADDYKVRTNSAEIPRDITDFSAVSSGMEVAAPGTVLDANVTVYIAHTYVSDLAIELEAPNGTSVVLAFRVDGDGDDFEGTVFDDEAPDSIESGSAPFEGSFRPQNALSAFDGISAAGTWTLTVTDHASGDVGVLRGWSLELTLAEPATLTDASGVYSFPNLRGGPYFPAPVIEGLSRLTGPARPEVYERLYGTTWNSVASNSALVDVDLQTGHADPIGDTFRSLMGLAFTRSGTAYGLTTFGSPDPSSMVRIDVNSGSLSVVGPTGFSGSDGLVEGDIAVDPTTGVIYGMETNSPRRLFTLNPSTGAATVVGTFDPDMATDWSAMAFSPDGTLYIIETNNDRLLRVDKTNASVLESTPLNVNLGAVAGMAFSPETNTLYVADGEWGTAKLYVLDIESGYLSEIGPTGISGGLAGLRFRPASGTYGLYYGWDGGNSTLTETGLVIIDPAGDAVDMAPAYETAIDAVAFDTRRGILYGIDAIAGGPSDLFEIDYVGGAARKIGPISADAYALCFNPRDGLLYGVNTGGYLVQIDPEALSAAVVSTGNMGDYATAVEYNPTDNRFYAYGGSPNGMYSFDASTFAGPVARPDPDIGCVSSMTFNGEHLVIGPGSANTLFTYDPATGAATPLFNDHRLDGVDLQSLTWIPAGENGLAHVVMDSQFEVADILLHTGSQITGTKFEDLDADGVRHEGEGPVAGATVYLDMNRNGVRDSYTARQDATGMPLPIRDFDTTESSIRVVAPGAILDVNVRLDIAHTYVADLDISLVGPNRELIMLSNRSGYGADFDGTVFDDEAAVLVANGSPPFSGSYRPVDALSTFDGMPAVGTWALIVRDWASLDEGTLESWALELTLEEPATQTGDDGGYRFEHLAPGAYPVAEEVPDGWARTFPSAMAPADSEGFYYGWDVALFGPDRGLFTVDEAGRLADLPPTVSAAMDALAYDTSRHVLYGWDTSAGASELYELDPVTGAATHLHSFAFEGYALAFNPLDGLLYAFDTAGHLRRVNAATGASAVVSATPVGVVVKSAAYRDGHIYGVASPGTPRVVSYSASNYAAAPQMHADPAVSPTHGLTYNGDDLIVSPGPNLLGFNGNFYTYNPVTGATTALCPSGLMLFQQTDDVVFAPVPVGEHAVVLPVGRVEDIDFGNVNLNPGPPKVTANMRVPALTERPDQMHEFGFYFSQDVGASLGPADLEMRNLSAGGGLVNLSAATQGYSAPTCCWHWHCGGVTLIPGQYEIRLKAAGISGPGGQLDGNGDGTPGDDYVWETIVAIPGDANLDGVVSDADYTVWADHYLLTPAQWRHGDFNDDDVVTDADYTIWADHYGENL